MAPLVTKPAQEWHREIGDASYLVSTSASHIDYNFVNNAFGTDDMSWAKSLPLEDLETMLSSSLFLGVYVTSTKVPPPSTTSSPSSPRTPSPTEEASEHLVQVGMARFTTDFVSMAYLDDVYVTPEYRKRGLSTWLIDCCKEVLDGMPHLHRILLLATPGAKESFYGKRLGLHNIVDERKDTVCMTRTR